MKKLSLSLHTDEKSIEYSVDVEGGTLQTSVVEGVGERVVIHDGTLGTSDAEKQEVALKMYHIILAAIRAPRHGEI
jgi:hypothetical protein